MRQALAAVIVVYGLVSTVRAQADESLSLSLSEQRLAAGEGSSAPDAPAPVVSRRFGEAGSWWWGFGAMGTISDDATDARGDLTFRTFLADDFELSLSLSGWGFFQDGEDAAGLNPGFSLRWHFVNNHEDGYSVYAQTGIGLLWANDEVPEGGTRFNFTPHVGVGATIELFDGPARLDVGVGWHHISNASTSGTDDNPGRDSGAVWIGVMFPF